MTLAAVSVTIGLAMGLVAAELGLRWLEEHIEESDHLDPGMVRYDRHLGWRLATQWTGRHRHFDFDVTYSTNVFGFRGDFDEQSIEPDGLRFAIVGDSFTFGIGVKERETFVSLLADSNGASQFLNFGVPGYSTDQEYLLVRRRVLEFDPDVVVLVVYLGNDLLDNTLDFPLHAENAKPRFELTQSGLAIPDAPVPLTTKGPSERAWTLRALILDEAAASTNGFVERLAQSAILRRLGIHASTPDLEARFSARIRQAPALFAAILGRLQALCRTHKVGLHVVLLPGRSAATDPEGDSARYQGFLRRAAEKTLKRLSVPATDLAAALAQGTVSAPAELYHPNEGHLSAAGHQWVAERLGETLLPKSSTQAPPGS